MVVAGVFVRGHMGYMMTYRDLAVTYRRYPFPLLLERVEREKHPLRLVTHMLVPATNLNGNVVYSSCGTHKQHKHPKSSDNK